MRRDPSKIRVAAGPKPSRRVNLNPPRRPRNAYLPFDQTRGAGEYLLSTVARLKQTDWNPPKAAIARLSAPTAGFDPKAVIEQVLDLPMPDSALG
jgi:hypothetical protein